MDLMITYHEYNNGYSNPMCNMHKNMGVHYTWQSMGIYKYVHTNTRTLIPMYLYISLYICIYGYVHLTIYTYTYVNTCTQLKTSITISLPAYIKIISSH